jgi:hypothetical protein
MLQAGLYEGKLIVKTGTNHGFPTKETGGVPWQKVGTGNFAAPILLPSFFFIIFLTA